MEKNKAYDVAAQLAAAMIQAGWIANPTPAGLPETSEDDAERAAAAIDLYRLIAAKLIEADPPSSQK